MKKSLLALALGGFGIGLTEFVVMGLLPDIAHNLNASIPEMGHMISAYALGVVIGAPVLTAFLGARPAKSSLIFLMILFSVFNGSSSFAPSFPFLIIMRFLSGLPHGAFFGIGAVIATRIADKGEETASVAMMFSGLTVANVIGVPIATYLGHHYSWRIAFGLVGLVGIVTLIAISLWVPFFPAKADASFRDDLNIFKRRGLWLSIAITCIGTGGFFASMSYIAPLFIHVSGFSPDWVPYLMIVSGVGMTVGNIVGGKLSDRFTPIKTIIGLLIALVFILTLNWLCAPFKIPIVILTFATGALALGLCAPIQVLLIAYSTGAEMLGASLAQASFNTGNALGAFLGGIPIAMGYSLASPQLAGTVLATLGVGISVTLFITQESANTSL